MAEEIKNAGTFSPTLDNIMGGTYSDTLNRIVLTPSSGETVEKEDFADFNEATKDVKPEDSYTLEELGNHKMRYEGQLGSFEFDDREFQVRQALRPADQYGEDSVQHFLSYVGNETDGKNITIPNGLRDMTLMFSGTNITSAPMIPDGVEWGNCAFMDCHQLKEAKIDLPASMHDAPFMFANCEHLENGPRQIPGTVKNADYMFTECASMKRTPKIGHGVESLNGTFMDCPSLTEAPKIPGSTKQARDTTFNCKGIDKQKDIQAQAQHDVERSAMERKLNRPSVGARLGSMFSAMMQFHSMHQRGYGLIMSAYQVHAMRKNGQLGKNVRDGFASIAARHGATGMLMANKMRQGSLKHDQKKEEKRQLRLQEWDRLHELGSEFNQNMKKMASNGAKDVRNGLFDRFPMMETSEKQIYSATHGHSGVYLAQEDLMRESMTSLGFDEQLRKQIANWYKDRLGDKEAYFAEAEHEIKTNPSYSAEQRVDKMDGLEMARAEFMKPLVGSMKHMQDEYQLFNQGDQRDIDKVLRKMGQPSLFHTDEDQVQTSMQNNGHQMTPVEVTNPLRKENEKPVQPVKPVDLGPTRVTPVSEATTEHSVGSGNSGVKNPLSEQPASGGHEHVSVGASVGASVGSGGGSKHEERVRAAEAISSDVKTDDKGKGKDGPEL